MSLKRILLIHKKISRIIKLQGEFRLSGFNITLPMTSCNVAEVLGNDPGSHIKVIFNGAFANYQQLQQQGYVTRLIATHGHLFNLDKKFLSYVMQTFADHDKVCGIDHNTLKNLPDDFITQLFQTPYCISDQPEVTTEVVPGAPDLTATSPSIDKTVPESDYNHPMILANVLLQGVEHDTSLSDSTTETETETQVRLMTDFYTFSGLTRPDPNVPITKRAANKKLVNDYEDFAESIAATSGLGFLDGYPYRGTITLPQIRHMLTQADKRFTHMFALLIKLFTIITTREVARRERSLYIQNSEVRFFNFICNFFPD